MKHIKMKVKPSHESTLYISNSSYYLKNRNQAEGESDLAKIASTAKMEANWIFYQDTNNWLYLNTRHKNEFLVDGEFAMGSLWLPVYESPLGKVPVYYHIHPDFFVETMMQDKSISDSPQIQGNPELQRTIRDMWYAWTSLPSEDDFRLITGSSKGYEHRIVTTIGVFILRCNSKFSTVQIEDYDEFMKGGTDPNTFVKEGFTIGLEKILEHVNRNLNGYVSINYKFHPR